MEKVEVTVSLGVSVILAEICNAFLQRTIVNSDGTTKVVDRDLPFRVRYRLTRNKVVLDRDVSTLESQRMILLAQYGELSEDGETVVLKDPVKIEQFQERMRALFDTETKHNLIKLDAEDLDTIRDIDINLSQDALSIFIGYMTNDVELLADLEKSVTIGPSFSRFKGSAQEPPKVQETQVGQEVQETIEPATGGIIIPEIPKKRTKKVSEPVVETPVETKTTEGTHVETSVERVEEKVEAEVVKPAKRTTKKTTTVEEKSTEKVETTSVKKTTVKKAPVKTTEVVEEKEAEEKPVKKTTTKKTSSETVEKKPVKRTTKTKETTNGNEA